ncbi:hypothetical protein OH786_00080 [Streptomyces atratus]|uniref:hypothetical protein n=1 Tax=Streptomyces atratus TaxID=1893 RepID=UPI00386CE71D
MGGLLVGGSDVEDDEAGFVDVLDADLHAESDAAVVRPGSPAPRAPSVRARRGLARRGGGCRAD